MSPSLVDAVQEPLGTRQKLGAQDVTIVKQNGVDLSQFKNPSLQVTAHHRIKMVDAPVRKPGRGEVLLHVRATGICGYVSSLRVLLAILTDM
jgi:hypothetical protein